MSLAVFFRLLYIVLLKNLHLKFRLVRNTHIQSVKRVLFNGAIYCAKQRYCRDTFHNESRKMIARKKAGVYETTISTEGLHRKHS